jgi:hypothetical protein
MQVFDKIAQQVRAMGLPVVAVSLTAVPRANTPVLLIVHWHGFAKRHAPRLIVAEPSSEPAVSIPGSAMQLNDTWLSLAHLDGAMLQAAWHFGAWNLVREERRGCNTAGATEREALECRQAFAEHPFEGKAEEFMLADAPDRADLMQLAAQVGYVRWQFLPVKGGLWPQSGNDDTLRPDGGRVDDCPVPARPAVGPRVSRTHYQLGHSTRIVLL